MPSYNIFVLPSDIPPNDLIIQRYKELRLLGLQTDPTSFVSTYEREVAYPPEKWREFIVSRNPWPEQEKATIVATSPESDVDVDGEAGGQSKGDVSDFRRAETERWVGMVVALAPNHEGVKENPIFAPLASRHEMKGRHDKIYVLVATLVHPEYRGKGIGKALMEKSVAWIEQRCKALEDDGVILLTVRRANLRAMKLYESFGFSRFDDDSTETEGEDTTWMYRYVS